MSDSSNTTSREVRIGSWNMLNAFGDERVSRAFEVITRMDADILYLCEMTHVDTFAGEYYRRAVQLMEGSGYSQHLDSDYTPFKDQRNLQTMSIWSRLPDVTLTRSVYGKRYALEAYVPGLAMTVIGQHGDDVHESARVQANRAMLAHHEGPTVITGDFNSMHRADGKSRNLRLMSYLFGWIEVSDYYDDNKPVQRKLGKTLRSCRFGIGKAIGVFDTAGYADADPTYQATWGEGSKGIQLDHIMYSRQLHSKQFRIHQNDVGGGEKAISDHAPITAVLSLSSDNS